MISSVQIFKKNRSSHCAHPTCRQVRTAKKLRSLRTLSAETLLKKLTSHKKLTNVVPNSNALLRDVNYPNEYVRGSTLRFLCKLKNQEILQPLVESIRNNLEHRHAYPRRNAVLAIYSIAKDFPNLIPDAAELIFDFLQKVRSEFGVVEFRYLPLVTGRRRHLPT